MFTSESIKLLLLGIIAGALFGIAINIQKIEKVLDSQFVSEDEYIELCERLGGTVVFSALNYPDCLESAILNK